MQMRILMGFPFQQVEQRLRLVRLLIAIPDQLYSTVYIPTHNKYASLGFGYRFMQGSIIIVAINHGRDIVTFRDLPAIVARAKQRLVS